MRAVVLAGVVVTVAILTFGLHAGQPRSEPAKNKPSAARFKGMKQAIADLEAGMLKQKEYPPLPYPPHFPKYIQMLRQECGVTWEVLRASADSKELSDEVSGYNDVMAAEVTHRFGPDIFEKLQKRASGQEPPLP